MKIGRNEKCWCGSGVKYKNCHLDRDKQPPLQLSDVISMHKSAMQEKLCSVPDEMLHECKGGVINAHTVSKKFLKNIAKAGHVFGFVPSLMNFKKGGGRLAPAKVGISQASTFTGFCSAHDKSLFSSVEDSDFVASPLQIALLSYRAVAREFFAKRGLLRMLRGVVPELDRGLNVLGQMKIQDGSNLMTVGAARAISDLQRVMNGFEKIVFDDEFDSLGYCVFEFDEVIPIACSGGVEPTFDFNGVLLQDLGDLSSDADILSLNAIPCENNSYVIFSWLRGSVACENFVNSLLQESDCKKIIGRILFFIFHSFENVYFSEEWWCGLSGDVRNHFLGLMHQTVSLDRQESSSDWVGDCFEVDWGRFRVSHVQ